MTSWHIAIFGTMTALYLLSGVVQILTEKKGEITERQRRAHGLFSLIIGITALLALLDGFGSQ